MARIITTQTVVKNGFKLINNYTDNSKAVNTFYEDDIVDDFSFVMDRQKITVSGRITNVKLSNKRIPTKKYVDDKSSVENDTKIKNVGIDYSEKNYAKVTDINPREILEYKPTKEVKKVDIIPTRKVNLSVTLSDDTTSSVELKEGMKLFNVTIQKYGKETTGNYTVKCFYYEVKGKVFTPEVAGMYLIDENDELVRVSFYDIKVCGTEGMVVEENASLSEVIREFVNTGCVGGIVLPSATYKESLTLNDGVTLYGALSEIPANTGYRCSDEIVVDESILSDVITCEKDASVVVSGITFTEKSTIKLNGAKKISFKNCKFVGTEPEGIKSYLFRDEFNSNTDGVVLQIENCYFGSNVANDTGKTYNLFELNCKLADGSYIKNNYFAKANCTHNIINLYDVMENATIDISGNYFEYSGNAIRVGFVGNATCTVNIYNNKYEETDSTPEYQGLLLIQPYGTRTISMKNIVINLDNNKYLGGECQEFYIYCGDNDTQINNDTAPTIYVNGKLQNLEF